MEKSEDTCENTMPIETVSDTESADTAEDKTVEKTTQELPRISVDDNGKYVVSDK